MAVFGFLASSPLEAAPPEPKGAATFTAYNLRNYLPMRRRVGDESIVTGKPEEEVAALIGYLKEIDPDILGVCEIGDESYVEDLKKRLKQAGVDLPYHTWFRATDPDRHLAVLSKFPIVSTNHQANLTFNINGMEIPFRRGILDATVQVDDDYQLRILGIHFKSKREVKEADQNLMRRNEADLLREHVKQILAEDENTNLIVYGDFNANRHEPPMSAVRGRYHSPTYLWPLDLEDENGQRWTYYWSYADQYSRFDFALASGALKKEVLMESSYLPWDREWYTASDHRPLVVRFMPDDEFVAPRVKGK